MALHHELVPVVVSPLASSGPPLEAFAVLAIVVIGGGAAILLNTAILNSALSGGDPTSPGERRNCPSCGAPTDAGADVCGYCNEPVPTDTDSDAS